MIDRYKKQELFLGSKEQQKILDSEVIIIGAGALGSSSAEMLVRAGVGKITIVDRDYVEWSNLQRQQLYTEADAKNKMPKAIAAKKRLQEINSDIEIEGIVADINSQNIEDLIWGKSVIVDATDNFETRLIVNDAGVKQGIPFIFGAVVGSYGLSLPIIPGKTPCLHCLLDHLPAQGMTCDTLGVISPIVQLVASFQVTRVLQVLTGYEIVPVLQSFDIWKSENAKINVGKLKKRKCPTCGEQPVFPFLSLDNQTKTDVLCGRDAIQLRPGQAQIYSLEKIAQSLKGAVEDLIANPYLVSFTYENHRVVLFKDGRAIIHGTHEPSRARAIYNRIIG